MNDVKKSVLTHEERRNRRQAMAEAVHSGKPIDEVAREYGVTLASVERACDEYPSKPAPSAA